MPPYGGYPPPAPYQQPVPYQQAYQQLPPDAILLPAGTHSQAVAVLLAIFCCAFAGQLYNRQYLKAIVMALVAIACAVVTGGLSVFITYPVFLVDTIMIAGRLNRGEPVGQWQFF